MAYANNYKYDIFISYASIDDDGATTSREATGWISSFINSFESILAARLGGRDKLKIFFDKRDFHCNNQLHELLDSAGKSALFLAVTSPAYCKRDWTKKELSVFTERHQDLKRLFAIEYLPLDDGEHYPDPLGNHNRIRFWERNETVSLASVPITTTHPVFLPRLHDLADQIKKQLIALNSAESARDEIAQIADVIALDAARREKGVVYLAQTTEALEEQRLQVRRGLEQLGILVLPSGELPGGGDAFCKVAEANIKQGDLYVHLLGAHGGRYPADLPEGYGLTQFNIAKEAGKSKILWRHPDLDIDATTDHRQRTLLFDQDVMACSQLELQEEVRRRIQMKAKAQHCQKKPNWFVFINADKSDEVAARIAVQEFAARNMPVALPLYEGSASEIRNDLEENMRECDVMVLIYGEAPTTWVRSQMRMFSKVRIEKPANLVAIFVGPPEEKPQDIGFAVPNLRRVDFPNGWTAEWIRKALEEIVA